MQSTAQKFVRLAGTYILGDIITKGGAFLLLPIYTRFLEPADYGILSITTLVAGLLNMLLSLGLTGAVLHFYPRISDDAARSAFVGSLWLALLIVGGVTVGILLLVGDMLFGAVFKQVPFHPYIALSLGTVFAQTTCIAFQQSIFRAQERASAYVRFSIASFALLTTITLVLVVWMRLGVYGSVLAQFIAAITMAVIAARFLLRSIRPTIHWHHVQTALAYGLPLVPHLLFQWVLDASDRIILERFVSLDELGVYSLAYQFGLVFSMLILSMNNSMTPTFSRASVSLEERENLQHLLNYYVFAIALIGLGIALMAGPLVLLLLPVAYHEAEELIPWIVLGYLCLGLYYIFMSALAITAGKTRLVPLATLIGASVNITMNLVLVPRVGVMAAAISTAAGFAVLMTVMFVFAYRERILNYEYPRFCKALLAAALLYGCGWMMLRGSPLLNLSLGLMLVLCFPVLLLALGFWNERERGVLLTLPYRLSILWQKRN
jgi:O-antigen/teichoic acid export membrane protein